MLVLSRKKDEAIILGDDIKIVVVEIREGKVRLGVEAPKEVPVHRQEIYEAIRREHAVAMNCPDCAGVDLAPCDTCGANGGKPRGGE